MSSPDPSFLVSSVIPDFSAGEVVSGNGDQEAEAEAEEEEEEKSEYVCNWQIQQTT